jgi:hypothetical protein
VGSEAVLAVFDGTATPYGLEPFSLLGLIPLGICLFDRFVRQQGWSLMLLAIGLTALVGINGITNWDIYRVRAMVASGAASGAASSGPSVGGLEITRGPVTQHWSITQRVRDMSKSGVAYKSIISEGFDIGSQRFAWQRGDSFSPATFSNLAEPRLVLRDGQLAEVTWFTDAADNNARRIVRLKLAR